MTNETDARQFDWEKCPWCDADYKDSQVLRVQNDDLGVCRLFLKCDKCAVIYSVERTITWKAKWIEKGKLPGLEAAEFLVNQSERMEKHFEADSMLEYSHKGDTCWLKSILCQESWCSGCQIYQAHFMEEHFAALRGDEGNAKIENH